MAKESQTFLNYMIFLILYVTGFIIFYIPSTEIIGFYFLFAVNTLCTIYNISYFTQISFNKQELEIVPNAIMFSIMVSGIFHSIAFLLVIIMISALKNKYSHLFGTPVKLPKQYQEKMEIFKRLSIATFSLCSLLLIIYFFNKDKNENTYNVLNINSPIQDIRSFSQAIQYWYPISVLVVTIAPVIISCVQIATANEFSLLNRGPLIT
jgi:hypothetical protein